MPVKKFRSVEEMSQPVWRPAGDPVLARAIASVWAFGRRLNRPAFQPGVKRFKSLVEMKATRS